MLKKYILGISLLVVCMFTLSAASAPVMTNSEDADVTQLGTRALAWEAQINFNDGAFKAADFVIMGEATDANDGPPADSYDAPKSPTPPTPYVYGYFDDGLAFPNDKLTSDYRHYCDGVDKQWNLTFTWDLNTYPETINFTWSFTGLAPEYGNIFLRDNTGVIVADMLVSSLYQLPVTADGATTFTITGENASCPAQGENCFNPYTVAIDGDLDYLVSHSTIGFSDDYSDTGMGSYDNGYDTVYQLVVNTDTIVDIIQTPDETGGSTWSGIGLFDDCPDVGTLLASDTGSVTKDKDKGTKEILDYTLLASESPYYLMCDNWPTPNGYDYDLLIHKVSDVGVTNINSFTNGEELNANVTYPVEVEVCNFGNDEASIPVHVVIDGTGTNYTPPPPPPTCDYEIVLYDSYGDGWDDTYGGPNTLDVLVNGIVVLDDITLLSTGPTSGTGPESHFFTVTEGDTIDIEFTAPGFFPGENYFDLIDGTGALQLDDYYPDTSGNWSGSAICSTTKAIVYDETVTVTLDAGECADVTLPDWYATPGNYTITACTELPTDDDNSNNCSMVDVVVLPGIHDAGVTEITSPPEHVYVGDPYTVEATVCNFGDFDEPSIPVHADIYLVSTPGDDDDDDDDDDDYMEDFEADDGGYTHSLGSGSGTFDDWEWGVPTSGPGSAHSGSNCWATNLAGDFNNNHNGMLKSVEITVPSSSPVLSFWHDHQGFYDWDCGNLKISTDGGATWSILVPDGGYPQTAASSNAGIAGEPAFEDTVGWEQVTVDMTSYAGDDVMIGWHFGSSSVVTYPGWYIDDVEMTGAKPTGAPISKDIVLDKSLVYSADTTIALLEDECGTASFSPDWIPAENGTYLIEVTTQLANDWYPDNDSANKTVVAYIPNVLNVNTGLWYTTIQEAVDAASPGDILQAVEDPLFWDGVADGYYENVDVNTAVTIMPYNYGEPTLFAEGGIGFHIMYDGTILAEFEVTGGDVGVHVDRALDVTVRNNTITYNNEGVRLTGSSAAVNYNEFCFNNISVAYYEATVASVPQTKDKATLISEGFEGTWISDPDGDPYMVPNDPTYGAWDIDGLCTSYQSGYPELTHYITQMADYGGYGLPNSGTYCAGAWWSDGNGGDTVQDEWLILPELDLSAYMNTEMTFYGIWNWDSTDNVFIKVSTDGGATWTTEADLCNDPAYEQGSGGPAGPGWCWNEYQVVLDLSAYDFEPSVLIAYQLDGQGSTMSAINYIDDVEVLADPAGGDWYTLDVNVLGNGVVNVDPDLVEYYEGTVVELEAIADPSWLFDHWEGDLTGTDNPATITMDSNKVVTAVFEIDLSGDVGIHYNYFGCIDECETPGVAIHNFDENVTLDARWNWYSAPDGPSGGTMDATTGRVADGFGFSVFGSVNFDPWWGIDACADIDPMNVLVGDPILFDAGNSFGFGFDEDDLALSYLWDFDNGEYSMEEQTGYSYDEPGIYKGYLRVAANDLDLWPGTMYDWHYFTIVVSEPGQALGANADGNDLGGYEGSIEEPVTFYGTASGGVPGYTFEWEINGKTLSGQTVEYAFTEAGTYTVELTVTDSELNTASDTSTVYIAGVDELVARAGGPYDATAAEPVYLQGSASGGKAPYTYTWSFGDGTTPVTAQNPLHVYEESGTYTVTLTVTDSIGNVDESTATVSVGEEHDQPEIVDVKGGLSVKATVIASDLPVDWTITFDGNYVFGRDTTTGTVAANTEETIRAPFVFGLGNVDITITANDVVSEHSAFMIGPIVLSMS